MRATNTYIITAFAVTWGFTSDYSSLIIREKLKLTAPGTWLDSENRGYVISVVCIKVLMYALHMTYIKT